jgi:hypothetical protein
MPEKAHVTSIDALEAFRSHLIIYLSQARPALDEVSAEVMRTRSWLETEQRLHWENQFRRRMKQLEQAQQALFSARIGVFRKETVIEQMAVHRAKASVGEADQKLRTIKRWDREYDSRVQPLVKQMEKLHNVLSNDMVKAVAYLTHAISTLAAYAEKGQPAAAPPSTPVAAQEESTTTAQPTGTSSTGKGPGE